MRRERRGASHDVSIRVARGLYYRPSTFRRRSIEWEETIHADTGLLGLTTKHIHFAGRRKRFRVRYDKIVAFDPFSDGSGIMRDGQTARTQTFRTQSDSTVFVASRKLGRGNFSHGQTETNQSPRNSTRSASFKSQQPDPNTVMRDVSTFD